MAVDAVIVSFVVLILRANDTCRAASVIMDMVGALAGNGSDQAALWQISGKMKAIVRMWLRLNIFPTSICARSFS